MTDTCFNIAQSRYVYTFMINFAWRSKHVELYHIPSYVESTYTADYTRNVAATSVQGNKTHELIKIYLNLHIKS